MDLIEKQMLEDVAREYLRGQLRERAPQRVEFAAAFDEAPLAGEGRCAVFWFELAPANATAACAGAEARHFVVVGETQANFSPAFGLEADQAYSLHIGTRFMLEVGVEKLPVEQEPENFRAHMSQFVRGCNPAATVSDEKCVLLFRCEDQQFAVYRVQINETAVYFVGGDLPPGFYEMTNHPPQVALRLHLGQVIRAEAQAEREGRRG